MRDFLSLITAFTSTLNALVAFFLAYKLSSGENKNYLTEQFKLFFIFFGLYFLLINILIIFFIENPYFFFVFLEVFHFILALSLAYLFSGFVYLKHQKKTKEAFWIFIIIGFTISLFGILNVNPEITNTLDTVSAYFYPKALFIPKIIYLGIGFMYPAISFLHQAINSKDLFVKKRYYFLALAFSSWLIGGAMHSRFDEPLFSIIGDFILILGFLSAGIILLGKHPKNK